MPDDPHSEAQVARDEIPPLITIGHPRLAQPSAPVPVGAIRTPEFQHRLAILQAAMTEYRGIGIAAPQIGWFERFFLMGTTRKPAGDSPDDEPELELEFWINPEIVEASPELCWAWEGCLSVPGMRGWIRRPAAVAVRGYSASGDRVSREFTGWLARVFQHEYDHLDGMLYPYRVADPRHLVALDQLAQRGEWPEDWPAPGAARAPFGETVPDARR